MPYSMTATPAALILRRLDPCSPLFARFESIRPIKMERFLLYLDDLDDLYGMVGLIRERLRRLVFGLISYSLLGIGAVAGAWLALSHAPIAVATAVLLFVTLLYRAVTAAPLHWSRTT